jgi:fumarate reductase flavoprotein subunit
VCSFAPAASALCGLLAGISCTVRNRFVSARRASTRYQPPIAPVGVGLLLGAIALVSGISYGRAEARFVAVIGKKGAAGGAVGGLADGTRSATVTDGEVSATVAVTVSGGRIAELSLTEARNVEQSVANAIFAAVKQAQSAAVDAVSGATASSQVLMRAIEAAAKVAP